MHCGHLPAAEARGEMVVRSSCASPIGLFRHRCRFVDCCALNCIIELAQMSSLAPGENAISILAVVML